MAGGFDRGQIPAAALDAEHLDRFAQQAGDVSLDRGVATAMQHQLGISAQQPR